MTAPRSMRRACESIGQRLAWARADAGLTQQEVADACDLTRPSIANLEAGRQDVPLSKLLQIMRAVHANPSDIIRASDLYELARAGAP